VIPAICLLGFLGSILLLNFADKVNPANRYLAYHFFLNSLFGISHWASTIADSETIRAIFLIHYFPFYFLNTPFLYFYVRAVLTDKIYIKKWDYLHFLPFVAVLINIYPFLIQPWSYKVDFANQLHQNFLKIYDVHFYFISFPIYFISRSIFSLVYITLAFLIIKHAVAKGILMKAKTLKRWLLVCVGLGAIFNIALILFSCYSLYVNDFKLIMDEQGRGRTVAVILMSALTISIYFFPKILYGLHFVKGTRFEDIVKLNNEIASISHSRLVQIDQLMDRYLLEKKFLSPGYSLMDLVRDIGVPLHILTSYFNDYKGLTFLQWRNYQRCEQAIQLMKSGKATYHTLESVGESCGYRSRSNFIQAFKAHTGESPSEYLKKLSFK
jgi:AraC-like DNA-binding protein